MGDSRLRTMAYPSDDMCQLPPSGSPIYGEAPEYRLNKLIKEALEKLLKVAHPASPEASWAALHLADLGFPRPAQPCAVCQHPRHMHGRNVCWGEGCSCQGRT